MPGPEQGGGNGRLPAKGIFFGDLDRVVGLELEGLELGLGAIKDAHFAAAVDAHPVHGTKLGGTATVGDGLVESQAGDKLHRPRLADAAANGDDVLPQGAVDFVGDYLDCGGCVDSLGPVGGLDGARQARGGHAAGADLADVGHVDGPVTGDNIAARHTLCFFGWNPLDGDVDRSPNGDLGRGWLETEEKQHDETGAQGAEHEHKVVAKA